MAQILVRRFIEVVYICMRICRVVHSRGYDMIWYITVWYGMVWYGMLRIENVSMHITSWSIWSELSGEIISSFDAHTDDLTHVM